MKRPGLQVELTAHHLQNSTCAACLKEAQRLSLLPKPEES